MDCIHSAKAVVRWYTRKIDLLPPPVVLVAGGSTAVYYCVEECFRNFLRSSFPAIFSGAFSGIFSANNCAGCFSVFFSILFSSGLASLTFTIPPNISSPATRSATSFLRLNLAFFLRRAFFMREISSGETFGSSVTWNLPFPGNASFTKTFILSPEKKKNEKNSSSFRGQHLNCSGPLKKAIKIPNHSWHYKALRSYTAFHSCSLFLLCK